MKILVGYDGSRAAEDALKLAKIHALAFDAEIIIATALEQSPNLQKEDIDKAESKLEFLRIPFNLEKIACETIASVSFMSPGENLVQLSIDNQVDEILIGVRKRSKLGKLLLGSTSQYIILNAPCPVVSLK